jgi:hypothetical protein
MLSRCTTFARTSECVQELRRSQAKADEEQRSAEAATADALQLRVRSCPIRRSLVVSRIGVQALLEAEARSTRELLAQLASQRQERNIDEPQQSNDAFIAEVTHLRVGQHTHSEHGVFVWCDDICCRSC